MSKNYLLVYSEQLATDIELLCQNIKTSSNALFQIRKSPSSIYANIREANYGQSKADMLSKLHISLKEVSESIYWLTLLRNTKLFEYDYDNLINLAEEIKRMLISSINTAKSNTPS